MDKTEFSFVSAQWKYPSAIFCTLLLIFFMTLIELGYRKWNEFSYKYEKMKEMQKMNDNLFDFILKSHNT